MMRRTSRTGKLPPLTPPVRPGTLARLIKPVLAAVSLYTFGALAGDVRIGGGLTSDQAVMEAMHRLASPLLTAAMRLITASGSGPVVSGMAMSLGIRWWRRLGRRAEAIVLLVTLTSSSALGQILKFLFTRPRPQFFPWVTAAIGWSFPSGHTLTAVVMGGLVAWLTGRQLDRRQRAALWFVAGLWAGLVGLSRIYLGVHYPSDVLASWAVGALCLLIASCVHWTTIPCPVHEEV
jgi:undecaprenyl-diphosphatase